MPFAAYCSFHSELYPIYSLCAIPLLNVPFTFLPYLTPGWPCGAAFPVAPPVLAVFCLTQLLAPRRGLSSTLRVVSRSPSAPLCKGWTYHHSTTEQHQVAQSDGYSCPPETFSRWLLGPLIFSHLSHLVCVCVLSCSFVSL